MKMVVVALISILLFGGGVFTGFLLVSSIFQSNTSHPLPEYIIISDVQYGVGSGGRITIAVNNTGIASVTIVKLLINNVKQSSVNPPLPLTVAPDDGLVLNITMNVAEGETYQIDLFTSQGNMFSKSSQAPAEQRAGIILYEVNVRFYDDNKTKKIDIDIGNVGTENTEIIKVYVGTSTANLIEQTPTQALPLSLPANSIVRITINYSWTAGTTYYIEIVSSAGQKLEFPQRATS
jgi:hypothetical protein